MPSEARKPDRLQIRLFFDSISGAPRPARDDPPTGPPRAATWISRRGSAGSRRESPRCGIDSTCPYTFGMKSAVRLIAVLGVLVSPARPRPRRRRRSDRKDLCAVPPGSQPLLPAKILEGNGQDRHARDDEVRTRRGASSTRHLADARFWFLESERSFLQAATLDPDLAMAYWGISVSAAGDYRPAFQLLRDPYDGGRAPGQPAATNPTIARTANGAAIDPRIRAREAIDKAMALRDKVSPRERLYIEAEAARRNPQQPPPTADHIAAAQARRGAPGGPGGKVDPRPGAARRLRPGDKGAAHAHDGRAGPPAPDHGQERRPFRRASLSHSWLGRQHHAGESLACVPALSRTGAEHPARAAHARPHLRPERQDRRCDQVVRRRSDNELK